MPEGVLQLSLQLISNPLTSLGAPNLSKYDEANITWERFLEGRELSGVWGYSDPTTGNLNSLGFVVKDSICLTNFATTLGSKFSWITPLPGTEQTRPEYPDAIRGKMEEIERLKLSAPSHEHNEKAEDGLIAVTVLVWIAIIALTVTMIFQYCREKKNVQTLGTGMLF